MPLLVSLAASRPAVQLLAKVPWASLAAALAAAVAGGLLFLRGGLEKVFASVAPLPPTARQLREEDPSANPLYRALPELQRLAWRQLGDNFPTPVHCFSIESTGDDAEATVFWVKREDLSSAKYGGNKVRTLQYQLGSCEAKLEASLRAGGVGGRFVVLGSGGSNQVVATKVHAACLALPPAHILGLNPMPDEPEMDNTLNFLSALSLPGEQGRYGRGWPQVFSALRSSMSSVFMPGGNNPLGILGQVGAALELAEQITRGELPDPDGIVVAMGSACTVTGLILGVALARHLGMEAFGAEDFRIYAQPVHPALQRMQRFLGFLTSEGWPMSVGRGLRETAALIVSLGGPDVTGLALGIMREELVISLDTEISGKYGAHSTVSRAAKAFYDESVKPPSGQPHLWLCGHFTAKSFALMLKLLKQADPGRAPRKMLFWQTKSAVQPKGPVDEWAGFKEQSSSSTALSKWAVVGGITGHPSAVSPPGPSTDEHAIRGPEDYQSFLTHVEFPKVAL